MAKPPFGPVNLDQEISTQTNEDKLLVQIFDAFRSQSAPMLADKIAHRSFVGSEKHLQVLNRPLSCRSHHERPKRIGSPRRNPPIFSQRCSRRTFRGRTVGMRDGRFVHTVLGGTDNALRVPSGPGKRPGSAWVPLKKSGCRLRFRCFATALQGIRNQQTSSLSGCERSRSPFETVRNLAAHPGRKRPQSTGQNRGFQTDNIPWISERC